MRRRKTSHFKEAEKAPGTGTLRFTPDTEENTTLSPKTSEARGGGEGQVGGTGFGSGGRNMSHLPPATCHPPDQTDGMCSTIPPHTYEKASRRKEEVCTADNMGL